MKGFYKRGLLIDLSSQSYETFDIPEEILRRYSGGKGIATYYLMEFSNKGYDPLSPEAPFVVATGPAGGSRIWGNSRYGIYGKSPLTGLYGESYSGGIAPEAISRTGFDLIVIKGKMDKLSYLLINENDVEFISCEELKGKGTYWTEEYIEKRHKNIRAKALVIGPAGENLVKFSVVENDKWRSAGRCGMGAILGSKNLKALVFAGTKSRKWAHPEGIDRYSKQILQEFKDSPITENYRRFGTPMMVAVLNQFKAFPTRYWESGYREDWERISGETLINRFKPQIRSCKKCFIGCSKLTQIKEGKYRGIKIEGPEYETIFAFGGICLVKDLDEIAYLNNLCDDLGLDTISAGNIIGYLIKLSEQGRIDYRIKWGETERISDTLLKIARCEGIGEELSKGIKYLEKRFGVPSMHVKGMDPAGYDPRVFKGMALSYGISPRGACHLRTTFYKAEISGIIAPDEIKGKAEILIDWEDRLAFFDSLIICRFFRDIYSWEELQKIFTLLTGETEDIKAISKNIIQITREFNLRERLTREDDHPSVKFFEKTLEGAGITEHEYEQLLNDYYRLRGW